MSHFSQFPWTWTFILTMELQPPLVGHNSTTTSSPRCATEMLGITAPQPSNSHLLCTGRRDRPIEGTASPRAGCLSACGWVWLPGCRCLPLWNDPCTESPRGSCISERDMESIIDQLPSPSPVWETGSFAPVRFAACSVFQRECYCGLPQAKDNLRRPVL